MPMYYFDVADGGFDRDVDGVECASFAEARDLALRTVPAIVGELLLKRSDSFAMTIAIRDSDGASIYSGTLHFTGGPPRQRR